MPSPHPAEMSGAVELLEVAEAILFSVPLPPTVLDKYKLIQAEVKGRIRESVSRDRDGASFESSVGSLSILPDSERALFQEKLAASKRKNAALQSQLVTIEDQLQQLTNKMAVLHSHHKTSLVEVQDQTRHACEESHARHLAELEARARLDSGLARQAVEDQLSAERTFHASTTEKIQAIIAMFPEHYEHVATKTDGGQLAAALAGESRHALHPNSSSRLQLTAFFESTRRALNASRHASSEFRDTAAELRTARAHAQEADNWRYEAEKVLASVERRAGQMASDFTPGSELLREREQIFTRFEDIEKRRAAIVAAAAAISAAATSASPARVPSSSSPPTSSSAASRPPRSVSFHAATHESESEYESAEYASRHPPPAHSSPTERHADSEAEVESPHDDHQEAQATHRFEYKEEHATANRPATRQPSHASTSGRSGSREPR